MVLHPLKANVKKKNNTQVKGDIKSSFGKKKRKKKGRFNEKKVNLVYFK